MPFLRQWVLLLAAAALVSASEDVQVECKKDSITVTWNVIKDWATMPSRLLLGSCFPSEFSYFPDGRGKAVFRYHLSECLFRQKRTGKKLIYENELAFRPLVKPNPAFFTYPVKCVYERPRLSHRLARPAGGGLRGQGRLIFHMGLLNDDLSGPAPSSIFPLGSFIHIWAAVDQQAHQPLMLHLDECVASTSQTLGPETGVYPIITNKGCLVDSKTGHSRFLPRYHSSSVLLQLQAFSFALEQEVYIHCRLVAWDPEDLNEEKKACNYNKDLGEWQLLDDPSKNHLCRCCDYGCRHRLKRGLRSEFLGPGQSVVLGPLMITASSRSGISRRPLSLEVKEK